MKEAALDNIQKILPVSENFLRFYINKIKEIIGIVEIVKIAQINEVNEMMNKFNDYNLIGQRMGKQIIRTVQNMRNQSI